MNYCLHVATCSLASAINGLETYMLSVEHVLSSNDLLYMSLPKDGEDGKCPWAYKRQQLIIVETMKGGAQHVKEHLVERASLYAPASLTLTMNSPRFLYSLPPCTHYTALDFRLDCRKVACFCTEQEPVPFKMRQYMIRNAGSTAVSWKSIATCHNTSRKSTLAAGSSAHHPEPYQ